MKKKASGLRPQASGRTKPKKPAAKAKPKQAAKPPVKKAAPRSRRARTQPGLSSVSTALARLRAWTGGRLDEMAPANDTGARLDAPRPVSGLVRWALPPSYAELLRDCSRLEIQDGERTIIVLSPAEIEYASGSVYVADESTNDLVPFATDGDDVYCFDVSHVRIDGEYSIHRHGASAPSFPTFAAWLAWVVVEINAR